MELKTIFEFMKILEECKDLKEVRKKINFSNERYGDVIKNYWKSAHITIKELREQLGMSQKEFADYICMSVRTIQGWESGNKIPLGVRLLILEHCGLIELSYLQNRFAFIENIEYKIDNNISYPKYSLIGIEQEPDEYC